MFIIGVDRVQLAMPPGREARAREFYCDVLELPERPKPPELTARGGCRAGRYRDSAWLAQSTHHKGAQARAAYHDRAGRIPERF
jgi:hypothetical protein